VSQRKSNANRALDDATLQTPEPQLLAVVQDLEADKVFLRILSYYSPYLGDMEKQYQVEQVS